MMSLKKKLEKIKKLKNYPENKRTFQFIKLKYLNLLNFNLIYPKILLKHIFTVRIIMIEHSSDAAIKALHAYRLK